MEWMDLLEKIIGEQAILLSLTRYPHEYVQIKIKAAFLADIAAKRLLRSFPQCGDPAYKLALISDWDEVFF
ncbi:MAG: hypothetical protein NTZ78_14615 [Candidatus Aureabacteria bacterium]|nr:hypothetical protein [Candidatus Auribacterota bacterium]